MKQSASAWSFGKETTRQLNKTTSLTTPGPGQYDNNGKNKQSAPGWKIGTEKRVTDKHNEGQPGPGQYNSPDTLGSGAPKFSMRVKTANVNDPLKYVVSPGPGNYNPDYGYKASAYSMRIRPNTASHSNFTPGPGQYMLRKTDDLRVPSSK